MKRIVLYGSDDPYTKIRALLIPEDMDIEAEKLKMISGFPPNHCTIGLADWLLSRGAKSAEDTTVLEEDEVGAEAIRQYFDNLHDKEVDQKNIT